MHHSTKFLEQVWFLIGIQEEKQVIRCLDYMHAQRYVVRDSSLEKR